MSWTDWIEMENILHYRMSYQVRLTMKFYMYMQNSLTLMFCCKCLLTRVLGNVWVQFNARKILGRKIMSFHRKMFKEMNLDRFLCNFPSSILQGVKFTGNEFSVYKICKYYAFISFC